MQKYRNTEIQKCRIAEKRRGNTRRERRVCVKSLFIPLPYTLYPISYTSDVDPTSYGSKFRLGLITREVLPFEIRFYHSNLAVRITIS